MSRRYIDADKVMEEIYRIGGHNLCEWDTIGVKALIDRQPTAEVVAVVRCKDCIYSSYYGKICHHGVGRDVEPEHYCGYGERSKNGK
jgi:hypothetical protein